MPKCATSFIGQCDRFYHEQLYSNNLKLSAVAGCSFCTLVASNIVAKSLQFMIEGVQYFLHQI